MVVATVDLRAADVVGVPQLVTRGWVVDPVTEKVLEEARAAVADALAHALAEGNQDHESLSRAARKVLGRTIGTRTRRRPMIVPVIVTV